MILEEIAARTRIRVEEEKKRISPEEMEAQALEICRREEQEALRGAGSAADFPFERALAAPGISFICEVKKASPSKGVIAEDFPYVRIAEEYEEAGASALSVLTEPYYFLGSDQYLKEIRQSVSLPILRKDFTVDSYQIDQAKTLGADAILLICALLSEEELKSFFRRADSLGLSALVEAHTEEEVRRALAAGARVVGVNNRDLKTFEVDVTTSARLRRLVPASVRFVSESGIKTSADVKVLRENGTDAVLIGEAFMRSPDKKTALAALRGV